MGGHKYLCTGIFDPFDQFHLLRHGFSEDTPCRFDVVGIKGETIRVTRNAF
jgi:Holliday junction resolvase-like predicted endonuclease